MIKQDIPHRPLNKYRGLRRCFRFQCSILKRISPSLIQQLYRPPILRLQTPLNRLELYSPKSQPAHQTLPPPSQRKKRKRKPQTHLPHPPPPPQTLKPHNPTPPIPLHRKPYIHPPMQLIHLPPNPRKHVSKINLVAQLPPPHLARAQRVQSGGDDGRGRFLVVEDAEGGGGDDGEEDREGAGPDAP